MVRVSYGINPVSLYPRKDNIMTTTSMKTINAFLDAARNSEYEAVKAIIAAAEIMRDDGGTGPMSKMLSVVNGKLAKRLKIKEKAKLHYATPLRNVLYAAGLVMDADVAVGDYHFDKATDFGVVWHIRGGETTFDTEIINTLKVLAAGLVSDKAFKEAFPNPTVDKPKKTVEECQKAVEKFLQKLMADNDVNVTGSVTVVASTLQITQKAA